MQKLILALAALFGLVLVVGGIFALGREIGLEGRVVAEPTPLVAGAPPVQVASSGEAGGGGNAPTEQIIFPTRTAGPSPTSINHREAEVMQATITSLLENPPEPEEGCLRLYVDATQEDVYIEFPFDARASFIPLGSPAGSNLVAIMAEGIGASPLNGLLTDEEGFSYNFVQLFLKMDMDYLEIPTIPKGNHMLRLFDISQVGRINENGLMSWGVKKPVNRYGEMYIYICE